MDDSGGFEEGRTDSLERLRLRLPAAPPDYLRGAVENPALGPEETVALLRNRSLPAAAIRKIARERRLVQVYDVKLGLVRHAGSPHAVARGQLGHLFWRDLADLIADHQAPPALRRDAERLLGVRLPELSLGERVALARRATPGVIAPLRDTAEPMVLQALFGNPRFLERDAVAVASAPGTPAESIGALAGHPTWGVRRPVRLALLANPTTPVPSALRLVEELTRTDLERVATDAAMPRIVRVAAERRLDRRGRPSGGRGFG